MFTNCGRDTPSLQQKSLYKVHFACDGLFPTMALASGHRPMLVGSPQGHLGQDRGGTEPSRCFGPLDAPPPHPPSSGRVTWPGQLVP